MSDLTPDDGDGRFEFDAFISYRSTMHPDKPVADTLQRIVETFPIPRPLRSKVVSPGRWRSRLKVFRDITDLTASSDLSEALKEKLRQSRYLIVICTPNITKSPYCAEEIRYFREYHGDERVLPLLVQGEPKDSFPETLISLKPNEEHSENASAKSDTKMEPLAADVRASSTDDILKLLKGRGVPKSQQARFKLLAPILGCKTSDELIQRDRARFRRQVVTYTTFVLLLALGFSVIAFEQYRRKEAASAVSTFIDSSSDDKLTSSQFDELVHRLKDYSSLVVPELADRGRYETTDDPILAGKRRADGAIALLRLGEAEKALGVLSCPLEDPEAMTQFVGRCRNRGSLEAGVLINAAKLAYMQLEEIRDSRAHADNIKKQQNLCYGLLVSLGDFNGDDGSVDLPTEFVERVEEWYKTDPSSAIHGACGWLLQQISDGDLDPLDLVKNKAVTPGEIKDLTDFEKEWFVLKVSPNSKPSSDTMYLTFVVFRQGSFIMGSPEDEGGRSPNGDEDQPDKAVTIESPFALCDREVTNALWKGSGDDFKPAIVLDWNAADEFCKGLNDQFEGTVQFRLPLENEWEYACRSDTTTPYSFGSDSSLLESYAHFPANTAKSRKVREVAQGRPNLRGLFDMHGNVCEWCANQYYSYRREWPDDLDRVARGGGGEMHLENLRSAVRILDSETKGLRLCLSAEQASN